MHDTVGGAVGAPSPELLPTVSAQELGVVLDLACNASAPVGRVLQCGDLFARLVKLANQQDRIGALVAPVGEELAPDHGT